MNPLRKSVMKTKVSLVITMYDHVSGLSVQPQDVRVHLEGIPRAPLSKDEGYFVFTDLPLGTYKLQVHSTFYMLEEKEIQIESEMKVVTITLMPSPSYPFKDDHTMIRTSVIRQDGRRPEHVKVRATVLSDDCARAKLNSDTDSKTNFIDVSLLSGKILENENFIIKERGKLPVPVEYCCVVSKEGDKRLALEKSFEKKYRRGSILLPVIHTYADTRGEVVVHFRQPSSKTFRVLLEFFEGNLRFENEIELNRGSIHLLEKVSLDG